ncbi:MAG: ABC transporter permease [Xanthomonadales bacterium]|nr:ABC transporter permease [Xanthomonadales bacterium]
MSQGQRTGRLRLAGRLLLRDWKSGELRVLLAALVIAVAALTAVAFLTERIRQAVDQRVAASLAADLRLQAGTPLSEDYLAQAENAGLRWAKITSMPSVVFAGDRSSLASVTAATEAYPLRGRLKVSQNLLAEPVETDAIPAPGEVWAAPSLLARLGVDVGAVMELGRSELRISGVLSFRPDEGFNFADLAPTLLINDADLAATALVQPGSRVSYRQLFAGPASDVEAFKAQLRESKKTTERLRDIRSAGPQIQSAADRAARFLNLASLVSVLLSAVAVAMAARRYSHRHRDRVALMKCLGASQVDVTRTHSLQLIMLALAGGVVGIAIGYGGQQLLVWLLRDFLGQGLPLPGFAPVWLGLVTAACMLGGFALPDLMQMGRTPPLRVLRQDIDAPPLRYGLGLLAALLAILLLLYWIVRDTLLVTAVSIGTALTFAILALAGWLLVRSLQGLRGAGGASWRYGLANLARRGRESVVQVVAFGLGIMVLLLLTLVREDLMSSWQASLPDNAPNRFMINIQPQEVAPIREFLLAKGINPERFTPMIRARMTAINGADVNQMEFADPRGARWARRESNLSFAAEPQSENTLLEGRWWSADSEAMEVSVEQDFASEMGLNLGDELSFDIAGESLSVTVTSFRSVAWDSFRPNFFMMMSPAALRDRPATYINSIYLPPGSERVSLDLMREYPSVTVIDLDAILGQVRDVMDKAALAVQAVFFFTLLAGLAVLWAAVNATRDERAFESAMLRSPGATRRRVLISVAMEFLAIGALAGLLATLGATLAGYLLATEVYGLEYRFNLAVTLLGPLAGALFVGAAGLLATRQVIGTPPVQVLRSA